MLLFHMIYIFISNKLKLKVIYENLPVTIFTVAVVSEAENSTFNFVFLVRVTS